MSKTLYLILIACVSCSVKAQDKKPKLVIGIVVDQMRNDYLQRFDYNYGENGFKRLIREGFYAKNNHYNYIPTYTGPGHASIYTGTTPKYHGIIGNSWYSRSLGRNINCVGDSSTVNVGGSLQRGKVSPHHLLANTITDELKLSSNFRSKVYSVSIKDRGAALPGGHTPDGAFWYDSNTGEFMTSTYYMETLPEWVKAFNADKKVDDYSNMTWETLLPIEKYTSSGEDNSPYEYGFKGKDTPTLPYDLAELRKKNGPYGIISSTPFGNSLVLDFAKAAITSNKLGKSTQTDFLAISLSSTDYVGHNFGPNAVELEDTYLRLDRDIEALLNHLDKEIGVGEYLIFLTADHGVVENPQYLVDHKLPGGFFDTEIITTLADSVLKNLLGEGKFILSYSNGQFFLDEALIIESGSTLAEVETHLAQALLAIVEVAETYTGTAMNQSEFNKPLASHLKNGYNNNISGNVLIVLKPGYLEGSGRSMKGTSHGTGYSYDTHVPLLFFGTNVPAGYTQRKTSITDIAPTVSGLINITLPNASVLGDPIKELFE